MTDDGQGFPKGRVGPFQIHKASAGEAGGRHRAQTTGTPPRSRPSRSRAEQSPGSGPRRGSGKKRGSFLREIPVLVVVALGLALLIKAFVVQAFYIPSASMEKTLDVGDRVLVNKLAYDFHRVHRGDIIVFNGAGTFGPPAPGSQPDNLAEAVVQAVAGAVGLGPTGGKDFIKRVIGLPGDHVVCCDERGRVTVNGVPLDGEAYIYPGDVPSEVEFDITVPAGQLWVMGDHRSVSADSRAHIGEPGGGTVPIDKVIGRAFLIVWPPSDIQVLAPPRTFQQPQLAVDSLLSTSVRPLPPAAAAASLRLLPAR